MFYMYLELGDGTLVAHSELKGKGEKRYIEVEFERARDEGGLCSARCQVPPYKWLFNEHFTKKELAFFNEFLRHNAGSLFEYAQCGGVQNA